MTSHRTPDQAVQEQLEAYNQHNLDRFCAVYSDEIEVFRAPAVEPVIAGKAAFAALYAQRFALPGLHAVVVSRIVLGKTVIDHERVTGLRDQPVEVAAVYEVSQGLIRRVWFHAPD